MQRDSALPASSVMTFAARGERLARRFATALDLGARTPQVLALLQDAFDGWGTRRIGPRPRFESNIGDDHSPFEFSVALGAGPPELRLLWEAQGDEPEAASNLVAARALTDRLAERWNVPLARLRLLEDLYLPASPTGSFALWHAVCFWRDRAPAFKVYLNPNVRGADVAGAVVRETLDRLGFRHAWPSLLTTSARRGRQLDPVAYVSLDLDDKPNARLKVYYRHIDATPDDIEAVVAAQRDHRAGEAREFCVAMSGRNGSYSDKPVQTCASFTSDKPDGPTRFTTYFPVASYAADDAVVAARVSRWMRETGLPADQYEAVLRAVAHRGLAECSGLQSYVSHRREANGIRSTVYFSPELYHHRESGLHPAGKG